MRHISIPERGLEILEPYQLVAESTARLLISIPERGLEILEPASGEILALELAVSIPERGLEILEPFRLNRLVVVANGFNP